MKTNFSLIFEIKKLIQFIKINKIDLVHVHHRRLVFIVNLIKIFTNVKIVYTAQVTYSNNIFFRFLSVDRAVAISSSVFKNLSITTNWYKKIYSIHNPADFLDILDLKIPKSNNFISCIARLDKVKNHISLLNAWAKTDPSNHGYILQLVGEGALKDELLKLVRDLKIVNSVKFIGYTDNVNEIIDSSDFMILVSHVEGHPLTVIEAAGRGVPTLLSNVDGSRDCVPDQFILPNLVNQNSIEDISENILFWINNIEKVRSYGQLFYTKWKSVANKEFVASQYYKLFNDLLNE